MFFLFVCLLFSGCTNHDEVSNELPVHELSVNNFSVSSSIPKDINICCYDKRMFCVDTNYLSSTNMPVEIIDSLQEQYATEIAIVDSEESIYYFIASDIMTLYNYKYTIYSVDKSNYDASCIYTSETQVPKEVVSAVAYNGYLYWSEVHIGDTDILQWYINKLNLTTSEIEVLCSYETIESGIVPVLSCNSSGVYWYTGKKTDNIINYDIISYSEEQGQEVLFFNVVCNNPYTKYISVDSLSCVLRDYGFEVNNSILPVASTELVAYYTSSEKYIVWMQMPEEDTYANQILYIYDIENKTLFSIEEKEFGGTILGCGIVKDYIYVNISNGIDKYNGMYFIDIENNVIHNLNTYLNNETEFSWPVFTENGELFFGGKKLYEIN